MNTDQARRIVALHDKADRALANLRNANSMSAEDPRATELLEGAGDAYAEATTALYDEQAEVVSDFRARPDRSESDDSPLLDEGFEPGKAVRIVKDGRGAGFIENRGDMKPGFLPVRLTTDAHLHGDDFPQGAVIAVAVESLSLETPTDAPSAAETGGDGSGEGQAAAKD